MKKERILFLSCLLAAALLTGCGAVQEETSASGSAENVSGSVEVSPETLTADADNSSEGFINLPDGQEYAELFADKDSTSVIARMYHAEPLAVHGMEGEWAKVTYNNLSGYVLLQYITFSKPAEQVSAEKEEETYAAAETVSKSEANPSVAAEKPPVQNNNITNNYNVLFLVDLDGFEYADPVYLSDYVEDYRDAWCSATSVYIYSQPDTSSAKREANMLYYGDTVTVLGSVGRFYYIATDSGSGYDLHGYVGQSYITYGQTPVAPEPANATHGYVNVASANVRSSPNKETNDNVLFTLYQGDSFDVISYDGYWYKIDYNGTICYISHKMVEVW